MLEMLLREAKAKDIDVVEFPFRGRIKGLYFDQVIGIISQATTAEKACILAEELGHYHTSAGNVLDQNHLANRKQEQKARRWGYERLVSLDKLIAAYKSGVQCRSELADFLGVTEEFLVAALRCLNQKYGPSRQYDEYVICFEPLRVFREIE